MNVEINHVSENGFFRRKQLQNVTEVSFDYGYEFPAGKMNPAVKIITAEERYVIIDSINPEKLTERLVEKLYQKVDVILPYHIFDWGDADTDDFKTDIESWFCQTHKNLWAKRNDANSVFSDKQLSYICKGNLSPILHKNISRLSDLWAQTLPTPGKPINVSKKRFFNEILFNFRRRAIHAGRL